MKQKFDSIDLIVLLIVLIELLEQNWSSITILNFISLALSAVFLILLVRKLFRR